MSCENCDVLEGEISVLESEIDNLKLELEDVRDELTDLEDEVEHQYDVVADFIREIRCCQSTMDELVDGIEKELEIL